MMDHIESRAVALCPDFFIIGAAKSGTTSLYHYLRQHPGIYMPARVKEPGYFCFSGLQLPKDNPSHPYPNIWDSVVNDNALYASLFADATDRQLTGEATPEYLYLAKQTIGCIQSDLRASNRTPKFIAILRNPIERLWSHYWMFRRDGYETLPLEEAISPSTIRKRLDSGWHPSYDYIGYGFYGEAIEAYIDGFDAPNVRVFLFDEFASSPSWACEESLRFLGMPIHASIDTSLAYNISGRLRFPRIHEALFRRQSLLKDVARRVIPYDVLQHIKHSLVAWNSEKQTMPLSLRRQLAAVYREDIRRLEGILRKDLSSWVNG